MVSRTRLNYIQTLMWLWSSLVRWKETGPASQNCWNVWFVAHGLQRPWNLCNQHCKSSEHEYPTDAYFSNSTFFSWIISAIRKHRSWHQLFSYWTKRPTWFRPRMHSSTSALSSFWCTLSCRRFCWAFAIHSCHSRTCSVPFSWAAFGMVWQNYWDAVKPRRSRKIKRN